MGARRRSNWARTRLWLGSLLAILIPATAPAAEVVLKFAGLAPEGTSFMQVTHRWIEAVERRTDGRVEIRFYAGGVMGDEPDVVRKIKLGQLHGAGLTGLGLGTAVPAVRILEQPFLFRTLAEVDAVRTRLQPQIEDRFAAAGYTLLAWAEVGFVYLFATQPIAHYEDLKGRRMWVWQGDPIAEAVAEAIPEVIPVPLTVPEMIGAVNAGNVELMYASPMAVVAGGLGRRLRYMVDVPLAYGTGAVIVRTTALGRLRPEDRQVLLEEARRHLPALTQLTRAQNDEALAALREAGLVVQELDPEVVAELADQLAPVRRRFVGVLYDEALLAELEHALAAVRANARP